MILFPFIAILTLKGQLDVIRQEANHLKHIHREAGWNT